VPGSASKFEATMNVAMVEAVSGYLPIPEETLLESVKPLCRRKLLK
jgi:hypothetical protein